jgi:mannose-6-phosphate isomerase-like protein (cupin superfamily)
MTYPEPRYLGESGEPTAAFRPADQSPDLTTAAGLRVRYLATGASTNGEFGLYRWDMGPQATGPGSHFHRTISESFFILSGTVRLFNGEQWIDATAGDFLFVPQGGLHGFRNESGAAASMLLLFAPGAPREPYFEFLDEVARSGRQPTQEEWTEFYLRHDTYWR